MAASKIELGPTGEAVRANIKRLRESSGLSYAELARRLASVGRPVPEQGIRRIEAGQRRVDVDDLKALAVVLRVPPMILLYDNAAAGVDAIFSSLINIVNDWSAAEGASIADTLEVGAKIAEARNAVQEILPSTRLARGAKPDE